MNTEVTRADTEFIADIDLIFKLTYYVYIVHRKFSNVVNKKRAAYFLNFMAPIQRKNIIYLLKTYSMPKIYY